jgi:hypothetical protein
MTKGSKMIRPVRITIVIGEPLHPETPTEGGRVPRRAIRDLSTRLGRSIQELFDEAQLRAGRPNPPRWSVAADVADTADDAQ